MKKVTIKQLDEKIQNILDDFKDEIAPLESKKLWYNTILLTVHFSIFLWVLSQTYISGNQVIGVVLLIEFLWFSYFFFVYVIKRSRKLYQTVKEKFSKYMELPKEDRIGIHSALDRATPHLAKLTTTSSVMYIVMLISIVIIIGYPFFNKEVTLNIFHIHPILTVLLFLYILLNFIVMIRASSSMRFIQSREGNLEKTTFSKEKAKKIAQNKKVQVVAVWITILGMSIPVLFSVIYTGYLLFRFWHSFNVPLEIIVLIFVAELGSLFVMTRLSSVLYNLGIRYQIRGNLKNLHQRIKLRKSKNVKIIQQELDEILYQKITILSD